MYECERRCVCVCECADVKVSVGVGPVLSHLLTVSSSFSLKSSPAFSFDRRHTHSLKRVEHQSEEGSECPGKESAPNTSGDVQVTK